eukprot:TRINITY_DN4231_c0_g2_i1.p1 TRINITY_DN4231_c0_g2~~TRINITY_DN4231_c0_g2_i1.p1  ORF type:complete len:929 (+),score=334.30 TRINITY_DN4231_c0_g2_i1:117-2903(+)
MSGKRACEVSVIVRVRPLRAEIREVEPGWDVHKSTFHERGNCEQKFTFENVISEDTSTRELYESCISGPIIQSCMAGFNATVFAYGQTGSGKSYTMLGEGDSPGVVPLAVDEIFSIIAEQQGQGRDYSVMCSMIEIYNEELRDLLTLPGSSPKPLRIVESPLRGVYVDGVMRKAVTSRRQFMEYIQSEAEARRVTGGTAMNERSSRSHCIVRLDVEQWERIEAPGEHSQDVTMSPGTSPVSMLDRSNDSDFGYSRDGVPAAAGDSIKMSALHLVDLAGSERISKSGVTGERKKEGANINKSLLFLGTVIEKLSDPHRKGHIPYRDSKLTRILQTALGGNSVTTVIAAVTLAEQHREETRGTLVFASRAILVRNVVHKNEVGDDKTRIRKLEAEVKGLRKDLIAKQFTIFAQRLRLRALTLEGTSRGEFEQLRGLAEQLQSTNEKLRRELATRGGDAAQAAELEAEIAQLRAQVGELQQAKEELELNTDQLQEEQDTLDSLCKELEEDNDAKAEKIERLRRERKELERAGEQLRREVEERDRRIKEMQAERQAALAEHEQDMQRARSQNDDELQREMAATRGKLLELETRHSALLDMFAKAEAKHRQSAAQLDEEREGQQKALRKLQEQVTEQAGYCRRLLHISDLVRGQQSDPEGAAEAPAPERSQEGPVRERDVDQAVRVLQGFVTARHARPPAICAADGSPRRHGEEPQEEVRVRVKGFDGPRAAPLSGALLAAAAAKHQDPAPKVRIKGMPAAAQAAAAQEAELSDAEGEGEDGGAAPVVRVRGADPVAAPRHPAAPAPMTASTAVSADLASSEQQDHAAELAAYAARVRQLEDSIALRDSNRDVIIDTKLKRMQDLVIRLYNTQLNLQSAVIKLADESRQLKDFINVRKLTQKLPANLRSPLPSGQDLIRAAQSRPIRDHHLWR